METPAQQKVWFMIAYCSRDLISMFGGHIYVDIYLKQFVSLLIQSVWILFLLADDENLKSGAGDGSKDNSEKKILSHIQSFLASMPSLLADESMSIQTKLHLKVWMISGFMRMLITSKTSSVCWS